MERKILRPYLVQRCTIKDHPGKSLDGFLNYDYMGSAEFEFGALYKALGQIAKDIDNYDYFMTKEVVHENGSRLCFICHKDFPIGEYVEVLKTIIEIDSSKRDIGYSYEYRIGENRYCLKESMHFTKNLKNNVSSFHETNVWWDLDNGVFFTFGKDRIKKLFKALKYSCMKRKSIVTRRQMGFSRVFSGSFSPLQEYEHIFKEKIGFDDLGKMFKLTENGFSYNMEEPEENFLFCLLKKDEDEPIDDLDRKFIIHTLRIFDNTTNPCCFILESSFRNDGEFVEISSLTLNDFINFVNTGEIVVFKKVERTNLGFS